MFPLKPSGFIGDFPIDTLFISVFCEFSQCLIPISSGFPIETTLNSAARPSPGLQPTLPQPPQRRAGQGPGAARSAAGQRGAGAERQVAGEGRGLKFVEVSLEFSGW